MKLTRSEVTIISALRNRSSKEGEFSLDEIIKWLGLKVAPRGMNQTKDYQAQKRRHTAAAVIRTLAGKVGNAGGQMVRVSELGRGNRARYSYRLPSRKALGGY